VNMTRRLKQIGHLRNVSLVHFSECIQLSELLVRKRFVAIFIVLDISLRSYHYYRLFPMSYIKQLDFGSDTDEGASAVVHVTL